MIAPRANASLLAVFIIIGMMAGVIYLFWQKSLVQEDLVETNSVAPQVTDGALTSEAETTSEETPE